MIDLHSHILPGIDDGAHDLAASLAIARMAVADGIQVMACTPHFMPGMYDNESNDVRHRVASLQQSLIEADINLSLVVGCDAHIRPDFLACLRDGKILRLNDSRYVLFEPPHNIVPQRLEDLLFNITVSGYVPVLTHPERLKWIEQQFPLMESLVRAGVWMQITTGSLTGRFGSRPKYWAERMLSSGMVRILATDAHNLTSRPPIMSEAFAIAEAELGLDEARNLVLIRPADILDNEPAENSPPILIAEKTQLSPPARWRRMFMGVGK
jgi:protein-tyrosine phosphatase